ncbi:MAG: penicillin-binding protein activator [Deltaproteobacteria bacterium]|nr:MAG: penicillin-binding protein activator [Deltaproteobacteria bacterium]
MQDLRSCGLRAALLAGALAVLMAGCALVSPDRGARAEAARTEYERARATRAVDPAAGKAALEAFVETWPRSQFADVAAFELAQIALEEGDSQAAIRRLRFVIQAHPKGDQSDAARLLLVRLELSSERVEAAYSAAQNIRLTRLSEAQRREAYRLSADVEIARGNPAGALRWLSHLRAGIEAPEERRLLDAEMEPLIESLDAQELDRAAAQLAGRPPADRLWLRRADLAIAAGDLERADRLLQRVRARELDPQELQYLAILESRMIGRAEIDVENAPGTAGAAGTLGVVLPLSGPFARFGEESLQGVLLAAGVFDPPSPDGVGAVQVVVRDSQGSPEGAAAAVRSLARDGRVAAIVGPLLSDESEAAARAADEAGVPLLALTRREAVAEDRSYVFRLGTTHQAQIERLVDYAVRELGAKRFAILYPDDRYGLGVKNLFWDAVEARGGRVVGVARYDVDAVDFAAPIRRLIGYTLIREAETEAIRERSELRRRAKRASPEEAAELLEEADAMLGPNGEPLPPIVDFDVLFLPDSHTKAVLIAPQLAFHEITSVRLFGASGWSHPDLLRIGGRHVEGAVFVEPFHPDDGFLPARTFAERFRERYGSEPGEQAAAAYDAANLVLVQLVRGLRERSDLRNGLLATRAYPAASGPMTILPDGNADTHPYLLGIESGEIVSLDGAR